MSLHDIRVSQQIAELTRRVTELEGQLEAIRSSLETRSDRTPTYTSNVTKAPTHSLPGRDSVRQLNETESSLTETLGVAETSQVATPSANYSKRPYSRFRFSSLSQLCEFH
jgi:chlorite dismutase